MYPNMIHQGRHSVIPRNFPRKCTIWIYSWENHQMNPNQGIVYQKQKLARTLEKSGKYVKRQRLENWSRLNQSKETRQTVILDWILDQRVGNYGGTLCKCYGLHKFILSIILLIYWFWPLREPGKGYMGTF